MTYDQALIFIQFLLFVTHKNPIFHSFTLTLTHTCTTAIHLRQLPSLWQTSIKVCVCGSLSLSLSLSLLFLIYLLIIYVCFLKVVLIFMLLYVYILTNVCSSLIPHTHKVITWRNDHLGVTPRWWLEVSKPKIHRLHHILGTTRPIP